MLEIGFVKQTDMDLFRGNAVPCLTKTREGDLLCAWIAHNVSCYEEAGIGHEMVAISRSKDGGKTWSKALPLFSTPGRDHGDPNFVWTNHGLQCYSTTNTGRYPESLAKNQTFRRESADNGGTWGDMVEIKLPFNYVCGKQHNGIRIADGTLLMGYSYETRSQEGGGNAPSEAAMHSASGLLRSTDDGYTWVPGQSLTIEGRQGLDEPAFVELPDGTIFLLLRNTFEDHKFFETRSRDGGRTWDEPKPSPLTGYNTPACLLRLKDDSVRVVWDNDPVNRWPLCVAVSRDGCRTWSEPRVIDQSKTPIAYPSAVELDDGVIVVAYWHFWGVPATTPWPPANIRYARFDREWLGA